MIEPDRLELFAPPRYRFDVGRRDFFRIAGSGLVVACAITNIEAQESGRNRREDLPTDIGAWLHVAADGTVTAYTGEDRSHDADGPRLGTLGPTVVGGGRTKQCCGR